MCRLSELQYLKTVDQEMHIDISEHNILINNIKVQSEWFGKPQKLECFQLDSN